MVMIIIMVMITIILIIIIMIIIITIILIETSTIMMIIIEIIKATKNKSRGEQNDFEMINKSSSPIQDKKKNHAKKVIDNIFMNLYRTYL